MKTSAPSAGKVLPLAGLSAILFALNAYVCRPLFVTEYTRHMGSIEGAYIGISRYVLEHPRDLSWFPLWYCGIPFQNSYPPLLHLLVAATAWLFRVSPALAHHALTAALYCLGPVTLFWLAYALSSSRALSFASALLYSLFSPSAVLMRSVSADLGSFRLARRLGTLVAYGDGPHVSSITLLPLAVLALHWALKRGGPVRFYAACLAAAAVVLTNWLGAFSLALAVLSYLLARSGEPGWRGMVGASLGIGLVAYLLASPWIPPSTISDIQRNAQYVIGTYAMGLRQIEYAALLLVGVAMLRWLLGRFQVPLCLRFGACFLALTGALALSAEWLHVYLVPQPERYHLEMELAVCLVAVFAAGPFLLRLPTRYRVVLFCTLAVLAAAQLRRYTVYARDLTRPIDIRNTVEFKTAKWLEAILPHKRVYAIGSVQFWMNAFADTPQMGGGFGQGIVNPQIPVVHYGLGWTEKDGAASAMWLRVFGAQAVVVSGPGGRDAYKQGWRDPFKFEGVLPELWRDGGDVIYSVPQRSPSLAHAILPRHVVRRSPVNNIDFEPVREFDAALSDPTLPLVDVLWQRPHEAIIRSDLRSDHLVSVQVTYHPGWRASVKDEPRAIRRDGLGFMVIEPRCAGPCEIHLLYDGGMELRLVRLASALAMLAGIAWFLYVRRPHPSPLAP